MDYKVTLAKTYDKSTAAFPYYCQPKFDGVRFYMTKVDDEVVIFSRNGNVIHNMQHITRNQSVINLFNQFDNLVLDGELYSKSHTFSKICSIVKSHDCDKSAIQAYVFDCEYDGCPKYIERNKLISSLGSDCPIVWVINETRKIQRHSQVLTLLDDYTNAGYEGIILRKDVKYIHGRTTNLLKLKKFKDAEFKVIGKNAKNSIKCVTNDGQIFSVTCYEDVAIGSIVTVKYQEMTERNVPRFGSLVTIRDYE